MSGRDDRAVKGLFWCGMLLRDRVTVGRKFAALSGTTLHKVQQIHQFGLIWERRVAQSAIVSSKKPSFPHKSCTLYKFFAHIFHILVYSSKTIVQNAADPSILPHLRQKSCAKCNCCPQTRMSVSASDDIRMEHTCSNWSPQPSMVKYKNNRS